MKNINSSYNLKFMGEKIRFLRKKKGLTSNELAKLIGVSQQQVSRYELGTNKVNIDILVKLSFVLEVPLCNFILKNNI